jgi:hypothetical protein
VSILQFRNAEHIITILKHEATEPVSLNCYCSTATNFWNRFPFVTLQVSTDWPTDIQYVSFESYCNPQGPVS